MTTYSDEAAARRAAERMRTSGVTEIRLLIGTRLRDVRQEPVGGFAGPVGPDAPVGTFGGGTRRRSQGAGAFAGDADRQRQGSFADSDRVLVVTYGDRGERTRVTGHRGAGRLLREAALDDAVIASVIDDLAAGRSVVLGAPATVLALAS
jgi:hypothetical protein